MKFRSKPVEIEAFQVGDPEPEWVRPFNIITQDGTFFVVGKRGFMPYGIGDWIIREMDGSGAYPCSHDIFKAKYEKVTE